MQLSQFINQPRKSGTTSSQGEFSQGDSNPMLASDRVIQLKKELEQLDVKLMTTNTINFEEMRQSLKSDGYLQSEEEAQLKQRSYNQMYNEGSEIEDHLFKNSQGYLASYSNYAGTDQSKPLDKESFMLDNSNTQHSIPSMLFTNSQLGMTNNMFPCSKNNTSHLSAEGDISFDFGKILSQRNQNIQEAFAGNLKEKKEQIYQLSDAVKQIKKECEAKTLKLTHLKYERDSLVNSLQRQGLKKKEYQRGCKQQLHRIQIKKREDEQVYCLAQEETRRSIRDQSTVINQILQQIHACEEQLSRCQSRLNSRSSYSQTQRDLLSSIKQQKDKIESLKNKKQEVETNMNILKAFLRQIGEEIQMTQEDLNSKLMQRAEFVAQREELDQMYDTGKSAFGKEFEIYLRINELPSSGSLNSARFLHDEYEQQKVLSFLCDIIHQLRQYSKDKHQQKIDLVQHKLGMQGRALGVDRLISLVCQLASEIGVQLDKQLLLQKISYSSEEKDVLFQKRLVQLQEINREVKRFEKLIKDNSNLVDNMILPQMKAMTNTFNDHKDKYKKLKQACFVLRERIKKGEKELQVMLDNNQQQQQETNAGGRARHLETHFTELNDKLAQEQEEMERLQENALNLEKEYRRALQTLNLKVSQLNLKHTLQEREVLHKMGNEGVITSSSFLSKSINIKDQEDDTRSRNKLAEIEEKLSRANQEKEAAHRKYSDSFQMLKEAQESFNHAKQSEITCLVDRKFIVMRSAQKIIDMQQQAQQNIPQVKGGKQPKENSGIVSASKPFLNEQMQEELGCRDVELSENSRAPNNRRMHYNQDNFKGHEERSQDQRMTSINDALTDYQQDMVHSQNSRHGSSYHSLSKTSSVNSKRQSQFNTNRQIASALKSSASSRGQHSRTADQENSQALRTSKDQLCSSNQSKGFSIKKNQPLGYNDQYQNRLQLNQSNDMLNGHQNSTHYSSEANYYNSNKLTANARVSQNNALNRTQLSQLEQEHLSNLNDSNCSPSALQLSDLALKNSSQHNVSYKAANQDAIKPSFYHQQNESSVQKQAQQMTFNNTCNNQEFVSSSLVEDDVLKENLEPDCHYQREAESNLGLTSIYLKEDRSDQKFHQSSSPGKSITVGSGKILDNNCSSKDFYLEKRHSKQQSSCCNTSVFLDSLGHNQSCLIDSSLVQCLEDFNSNMPRQSSQCEHDGSKQRSASALRRSSVDTADFYPNQNDFTQGKAQTIEAYQQDRYGQSNVVQYARSPDFVPVKRKLALKKNIVSQNYDINVSRVKPLEQEVPFSNDYYYEGQPQQSTYNPAYYKPLNQNWVQQNPSYGTGQACSYPMLKNNKSQYLSGQMCSQGQRANRRHESISPQPIITGQRHGSKSKQWNRSLSLEQRYNNKNSNSICQNPPSANFNTIHNQSQYEGLTHYKKLFSRFGGKKNHKLNKSLNNVDSSMVARQSINTSKNNPITMSINFNNVSSSLMNPTYQPHQHSCSSNPDLDYLHFSRLEVSFAERILPLLDGSTFYKKFSSRQLLNENAFDPLNADKFPPEACGFGIRLFQLDKSLSCINVKQSLKNAVETSIQLDEIVKPILPQTTMDIIKSQKHFQLQQAHANLLRKSSRNPQYCIQSCNHSTKDLLEEFLILETKGGISHLAKIGIVNKNSDLYKQKCLDSTYYPFSLALSKGRVELIATSYEVLKNWIIGINLLVSNKKHLNKMKQLMELRLD